VASRQSPVAVALLGGSGEFDDQLRTTLASLGAAVVYQAAAGALDREALERSHANVVVVNLDAGNDPDLDQVYDLLDDERYRVVFNDAEASRGLTGWDQARWMRHLAAKVLGDADTDPPRPEGAEAVPVRAAQADAIRPLPPRDDAPEASETPAAHEESHDVLAAQETAPAAPVAEAGAAAESFDVLGVLQAADEPAGAAAVAVDDFAALDLDALIEIPDVPVPPSAPAGHAGGIDLSEFGDFALDEPASAVPALERAFAAAGDVARPLEESPAEDAPGDDFAFEFEPASIAPAAAPVAAEASPAPVPVAAPAEWTLEDIFDGAVEPPPVPPAADFGIEKLSAEEFLAPAAQDSSPPPVETGSGLKLELVPLEEAVAPTPVEAAHENWVDPGVQAAKVRRVWVLGASIGGPEAVREFLGALPRDYPALFLLAQHLGEEFVDMMARQLAQATPLTVRMPTHGERVGHGEVVIVPIAQRLRVDAQGVVVLQRDEGDAEFKPSIDRVLRDAADRFGAGAGAIVFSGMSSDALEGCRYLTSRGGVVYAQRPDTCVVSSMVDGVCEAGLASFLGSPRELAEKLLAETQ
jgi:two-component system chemotaxis response regulator CheB/chemosensory pili system protein ChpB (putative protein-glutamate methylesterase)